jgi:hypothetical protein
LAIVAELTSPSCQIAAIRTAATQIVPMVAKRQKPAEFVEVLLGFGVVST